MRGHGCHRRFAQRPRCRISSLIGARHCSNPSAKRRPRPPAGQSGSRAFTPNGWKRSTRITTAKRVRSGQTAFLLRSQARRILGVHLQNRRTVTCSEDQRSVVCACKSKASGEPSAVGCAYMCFFEQGFPACRNFRPHRVCEGLRVVKPEIEGSRTGQSIF